MLALTLALPLFLPVQQDADEKPAPTTKQVEAAVEKLEAAFAKKEDEQIQTALQALQLVPHEDVIELLVDEGLKHRHQGVRRASIESLGVLDHDAALKALHSHAKRKQKALRKQPEQYVTLLRSIALHEDESSITVLTKDIFTAPHREVIRARVLGLGRIRSRESVKAIFGLMKKSSRNKVQPYMEDFRLALIVLTHVDQGTSQDLWLRWWNDNKKTFKVPPKVPRLPEQMQNRWGRFWGEQRQYQRQKRRGERGDDRDDDGLTV